MDQRLNNLKKIQAQIDIFPENANVIKLAFRKVIYKGQPPHQEKLIEERIKKSDLKQNASNFSSQIYTPTNTLTQTISMQMTDLVCALDRYMNEASNEEEQQQLFRTLLKWIEEESKLADAQALLLTKLEKDISQLQQTNEQCNKKAETLKSQLLKEKQSNAVLEDQLSESSTTNVELEEGKATLQELLREKEGILENLKEKISELEAAAAESASAAARKTIQLKVGTLQLSTPAQSELSLNKNGELTIPFEVKKIVGADFIKVDNIKITVTKTSSTVNERIGREVSGVGTLKAFDIIDTEGLELSSESKISVVIFGSNSDKESGFEKLKNEVFVYFNAEKLEFPQGKRLNGAVSWKWVITVEVNYQHGGTEKTEFQRINWVAPPPPRQRSSTVGIEIKEEEEEEEEEQIGGFMSTMRNAISWGSNGGGGGGNSNDNNGNNNSNSATTKEIIV